MTLVPALTLPDGRWLDPAGDIVTESGLFDEVALTPENRAMWEAAATRGGHTLDELLGAAEGYTPDVGAV